MKKFLITSLAGLVVLGGCAFGSDDGAQNNPQNEDGDDTENTQQEEDVNQEDENQDNATDENESDMNNDENDSTNKNDEEQNTDKSDETNENNSSNGTNQENTNNEDNQSTDDQSSNTDAKNSMDKGRAEAELNEYEEAFKKVINYTTDDGELKEYKTKDKLKEHFMHFMSSDQADELINTYFVMKEGALHVKAMDGPQFLNSDQPFEFKQGNNGNYKVVQEQDNQLTGHIQTTYTLTVNDGGYWIIEDVTSESLE